MTTSPSTSRRSRLRSAALLCVALLVVGCGHSSSGLTRGEYVAKVNAMCRDFGKRERKIGEPHSFADVAAKGKRIAALFADAVQQPLEQLTPPSELADEHAKLRRLAQRQHDVLLALAGAAETDILRAQRLVQENTVVNRQAAAVARQIGASDCAS